MTHHYVKSGFGTATSNVGFGSAQTGSFATIGAASSYASITLAFTHGAIADGDVIACSDLHAESIGSGISYTMIADATVTFMSVDDTAANTLKAGASETATGNNTITFSIATHTLIAYGMTFSHGNDLQVNAPNARHLFRNCTFVASGSGDICWRMNQDGIYGRFEDCTFNVGHTNASAWRLGYGCTVEVIGGSITGSATTKPIDTNSGDNGGFQLYMLDFDFTNCGTTATLLAAGGWSADDSVVIKTHNCKTLSGQSMFETPVEGYSKTHLEAVGCDDTEAFRYEFKGSLGQVINSTSTYVTSDTVPEGVTPGYSYQVNTVASCSKTEPFRWMLPLGYADLSVASTDNIRVRITSASALNQEEVAVFVGTSDATNNTEMNLVSTIESKAESSTWMPDHTATGGTALATDSSQWTSAQTNEYALVVDLSAVNVDATSPLAPTIWLEVYTDATFFVSSQLVFEA